MTLNTDLVMQYRHVRGVQIDAPEHRLEVNFRNFIRNETLIPMNLLELKVEHCLKLID